MTQESATRRRYDLDWLRIIAFGLLILYHIGMLYVARWGFHYKSAYTSTFLENLMLIVNPWRMPLLWMISGIATAFVLARLGWLGACKSRTVRLLVPLAFGVWVIVPPQLFVEMSAQGAFSGSYLEFYRRFFDLSDPMFDGFTPGIWPHVDVNHLWYLRELWTFTLLLMLAMPVVSWLRRQTWLDRLWLPGGSLTILFALPLLLSALDLAIFPRPGEHGRREAIGLTFFVLGFLVIERDRFWQALSLWRRWSLGLALATYALYVAGYHLIWLAGSPPSTAQGIGIIVLDEFNRWFWLATLFGYAHEHLNRPHRWLTYLTPAVYPFYIVHQTLIVVAAFWLTDFQLGPVVEPALVVLMTFSGCVLTYEIARRVRPLRPLLGLRLEAKDGSTSPLPAWARRAATVAAVLIVLPIGFEILV